MGMGRKILGLAVAAGVVALGAAFYPDTADQIFPGSGVQAKKLRAMLPFLPAATAPTPATAVAPPARPPVTVTVSKAQRKSVPMRIDVIGTAQPMASVVLRSRVDSQIDQVLISDGANVKAGDILVKLDSRQLAAQIQQAQAVLAKDQTQLAQGQRDVSRYADLVAKQAGTQINLDNAKTTVAGVQAAILGDQAALDNLKVQLSYYTITAPIDGRVGTVAMKAGNIARQGEAGTALATINQINPIYVNFSVRQDLLDELRASMKSNEGEVTATPQGSKTKIKGKISVIDNSVDAATGTIGVKAMFENVDETLWPGQLCNLRIVLRNEPNAVTVPRASVQSGQVGNFVYVIDAGKAKLVPVKPGATIDEEIVIRSGLEGTETVVTEGALLLNNGASVNVRDPAAATAAPKPEALKTEAPKTEAAKTN